MQKFYATNFIKVLFEQYVSWTSLKNGVGNYSSRTPVFCLQLPGVKLESFIELVSIHKPFKALVLHSDAEYIQMIYGMWWRFVEMENSLVYHTSHCAGMSSPWHLHALLCKLQRAVRGWSALCITWCLWCVAGQELNAN